MTQNPSVYDESAYNAYLGTAGSRPFAMAMGPLYLAMDIRSGTGGACPVTDAETEDYPLGEVRHYEY